MLDDGNAQPSCVDLRSDVESNGVKMEHPTMTCYDGSPLVSGQSGLATSGDGVAAQICQASSQSSAQSDPNLKAHDYIGLSEISSKAVRAEQSTMHEEQRQMVAGERLNLNLQETELRLGPPKPAAGGVEVGAPFQPKQGSVHAAMDGKEAEVLNAALGQSSVMGGPTNHESFQKVFGPCKKGDKEIIPALYVKELEDGAMQKMFGRTESFKRRYAEDNVQVWDLGIGLSPQIMAYPQEEVGENKVSCSGGRIFKKSTMDSQEQFTKKQELIHQVLAPLEPPVEDEQKPLPPKNGGQQDVEISRQKQLPHGTILGPAEYGRFGHDAHGSPHLQELTAAHRFWQAQMMLRAADGVHFPRNYEPQSPHFSQDLETSKPSFGRTLNGITGARVMPTIPRNTTTGAKRVFSETIGNDAVVLNGNAKVANSGVMGAADSESKAFNQHVSSSMFSWSSAKQPLASWPLGLDCPSGAATFGPFPSPGQSLIKGDAKILPKEYHFEASPEKFSATGRRPQSEPRNGLQDAQNSPEDNTTVTAPRAPVGWPPVQSFRKNSLPPPKPKKLVESEASPIVPASSTLTPVSTQSECLFVKVYMDGLPIGRKVDLKIYNNYEKLSIALEEMFKGFINGQCGGKDQEDAVLTKGKKLNFLCNSDYVITYEDKDGDLMLVGDVPWGMFIVTVKRLRIMKGSEAIGLAPRPSDKVKCS